MTSTRSHQSDGRAPAGRSAIPLIADGTVDLFLNYASIARLHANDPALKIVQLPAPLSPSVSYGVALSLTARQSAVRLRDDLLSERAQSIFAANGFLWSVDRYLDRAFINLSE